MGVYGIVVFSIELFFLWYFGNFNFNVRYCGIIYLCGMRFFIILADGIRSGAPNGNFRENICSEDDLRTRIFGTFVAKFLAFLLLLGFSKIYKMV